ncbi:NAD(P)H-dependent flavin oxidoreductase [Acuticoccus sediminis]|uniref:NAD(P)H-dependent flavin oxidoreductase n=1 Tax=Acuticoccus sediminis TaxID=2184697 RepID=UPI001CFC9410|nr:nitronate monooxygenase [Acuticoccus sediminis]
MSPNRSILYPPPLCDVLGCDVLIAQGVEAGGHVHGRMVAFALASQVLSETRRPVVIPGGIATGAGLADAFVLGAAGVQCGTAFLATDEAFAHDYHKARIVESEGADTVRRSRNGACAT